MKEKKIILNYRGKKISLNVLDCNIPERGRGLMFRRKEKARALMFDLKKPSKEIIHSFFVFFKFVAVWCDEKNNVLEIMVVTPFKPYINPKKSWTKLIEIPVNRRYREVIKLLVGG